jgi:hypothetical protein
MSPSGSSLVLLNASERPSGDQVGQSSTAGLLVIRRTCEPSSLSAQTSVLPLRTESNATHWPSEDSAGCASAASSWFSRLACAAPSARYQRSPVCLTPPGVSDRLLTQTRPAVPRAGSPPAEASASTLLGTPVGNARKPLPAPGYAAARMVVSLLM